MSGRLQGRRRTVGARRSLIAESWIMTPRVARTAITAMATTLALIPAARRGSPNPVTTAGQEPNSALAGHRDTFFRPLKSVRAGDEIRLTTPHGHLRYRVERTRIVNPDDLSVLDPLPKPSLTLITCFPFSYIGNAPRRFIVQANRIGSESS